MNIRKIDALRTALNGLGLTFQRWVQELATPEVTYRRWLGAMTNLGILDELELIERWENVREDFVSSERTLAEAVNKSIAEAEEEAHRNWWADEMWNR